MTLSHARQGAEYRRRKRRRRQCRISSSRKQAGPAFSRSLPKSAAARGGRQPELWVTERVCRPKSAMTYRVIQLDVLRCRVFSFLDCCPAFPGCFRNSLASFSAKVTLLRRTLVGCGSLLAFFLRPTTSLRLSHSRACFSTELRSFSWYSGHGHFRLRNTGRWSSRAAFAEHCTYLRDLFLNALPLHL